MNRRMAVVVAGCALAGAACAGSSGPAGPTAAQPGTHPSTAPATTARPPGTSARSAVSARRLPVAFVTAEGENRLLAVSLPGGHVIRRVPVAADPTTVASGPGGPAVVVSPASGTVTVLGGRRLHTRAVLRGFGSPQIAAVTPDGEWALVTDAASGTVSAIRLADGRLAGRVGVGKGAHHLAVSPDRRTAWVALGETARTIVALDISRLPRMRVVGRLHPAVAAHDLAFGPSGRTVWVTSAGAGEVTIYSARTRRPLATVAAGVPPQHIAFGGPAPGYAYVTSGYGGSIEMVDPRTRRIVRRARLPHGSFNLAVAGDTLVTTSLLDGRVTELDAATLRRLMTVRVAPEARALALG